MKKLLRSLIVFGWMATMLLFSTERVLAANGQVAGKILEKKTKEPIFGATIRLLRDGQAVWLETESGRKVRARVKLTQTVHPEGAAIAGCAGHWTDGMPVAKDKGVFFNELLEIDWAHSSPVNLNLDLCARIRISPAGEAP